MTAPPEKNNFRQTAWLAAISMTIAAVWLHFYFLFHAGGFGTTKSISSILPDAIHRVTWQKIHFPC